jgi:hypothetical protein
MVQVKVGSSSGCDSQLPQLWRPAVMPLDLGVVVASKDTTNRVDVSDIGDTLSFWEAV